MLDINHKLIHIKTKKYYISLRTTLVYYDNLGQTMILVRVHARESNVWHDCGILYNMKRMKKVKKKPFFKEENEEENKIHEI